MKTSEKRTLIFRGKKMPGYDPRAVLQGDNALSIAILPQLAEISILYQPVTTTPTLILSADKIR